MSIPLDSRTDELTPLQLRLRAIERRKAKLKEQDQLGNGRRSRNREVYMCICCDKKFKSENALKSHMNSTKHRMVAMSQRDADGNGPPLTFEEMVSGPEKKTLDEIETPEAAGWRMVEDAICASYVAGRPLTEDEELNLVFEHVVSKRESLSHADCPFCTYNAESETREDRLVPLKLTATGNTTAAPWFAPLWRHIVQDHNLRIPEPRCLADAPGLVAYLQVKIGQWYSCLSCHQMFKSREAVRHHMHSVHHLLLNVEENYTLQRFYDYSRNLGAHFATAEEAAKGDFTEEQIIAAQKARDEAIEEAKANGPAGLGEAEFEEECKRAGNNAWFRTLMIFKSPMEDPSNGSLVLYNGAVLARRTAQSLGQIGDMSKRHTFEIKKRDAPTSAYERSLQLSGGMKFPVDMTLVHKEMRAAAVKKQDFDLRVGEMTAVIPRPGFKNQNIYLI